MASRWVGLWFLLVGASAALTHVLVFALTKDLMLPELANAVGFCVAFYCQFFWPSLAEFSGHEDHLVAKLTAFCGHGCGRIYLQRTGLHAVAARLWQGRHAGPAAGLSACSRPNFCVEPVLGFRSLTAAASS